MSFRKRGVIIPQSGASASTLNPTTKPLASPTAKPLAPGTRPSPLDGRLTTSTGTKSLDALLAGNSGLALGTSLLISESGTTDFAGSLLKYYAAEGVVQGHTVHVLGIGEPWGRELPGLGEGKDGEGKRKAVDEEKMKIAWRYERLGEFGAGSRERSIPQSSVAKESTAVFCHDFDLSKRLILPSQSNMYFVPLSTQPDLSFKTPDTSISPFTKYIQHLVTHLSAASPTTIHRVVIPNLLSPALYPSHASNPAHVLQFLHTLRALFRKHATQMTALITLPLTLHPRNTGLTRWIELLSDGVLELAPFPSSSIVAKAPPGASAIHEEPPQGMLKVHRLPIFHEKGGGGGEASGFGDDLAFTLSRRRGMVIKPFSLPPVEGDQEAQQAGLEGEDGKKATKVDIEF
ncbi:hypothetical protein G7Y89_g3997 [Cudoniella acicularis]|uniref:Elongator complex protein 4 n=1 Tax=Cudoniella acicularis TaxID=354080 RepID=A0A8H4RSE9_9HELO|nr:hypothetical protein G7Y89_g3997 [Cudoniella acicularis]